MPRGKLRVYLGAAPGVGKTFAMLDEAHRRRSRGTDVVVAVVETHGRVRTVERLGDLEVVARREIPYRGTTLAEMDVDAVIARHPDVALVDELAHTNAPGSRNTKRHQDVEELLAAGIDVITTVNIQHLESVNDVVERITGVTQRETVPDDVVRAAEQIELVDMDPEALRRRLAHGNIYAAEKIDAALSNYFRSGNLAALRELALLWVADQVEVGLDAYRDRHGISEPWETRERVVVAVTGAPGADDLIRRAARIARRAHADLVGVHVRSQAGLADGGSGSLAEHRKLIEELGGRYRETAGADVAAALLEAARAENATQLVVGATERSRWQELTSGSVINRAIRLMGPIDVHITSHEGSGEHGGRTAADSLAALRKQARSSISLRRRSTGWALAAVGPPTLAATFVPFREDIRLPTMIVLFLLLAVINSSIGGIGPGLLTALVGFLSVNWFFTPPYHRLTVSEGENLVALVVYLITTVIVSGLVTYATRRNAEAARAGAEAQTLASLAGSVVEVDPLPAMVAHLTSSLGLQGAALLRRANGHDEADGADGAEPTGGAAGAQVDDDPSQRWLAEASAGDAPTSPDDADATYQLRDDLLLVLRGQDLVHEDRRMLDAFGATLAASFERRSLHQRAARAAALAEADELRSALLQAVSHDLRTPLAGIKASADSLRQSDIEWPPEQTAEFLTTIVDETDRLTALVDNLLDMSRIQAGAVGASPRPTSLDEVVPAALADLGLRARTVRVDVEGAPLVEADPSLLERVVANLADNAVTYGGGTTVRVTAGAVNDRVLLRVVDSGPGIPPDAREAVFAPFQRTDDATPRAGAGVGLGLAVARGFTRAMGGELSIEDTPGGGTTMVVDLAAAPGATAAPLAEEDL